ncbi:MAG: zf-HC2 domain-containing protein, partial [Bauldia sp.]|nr:zf-HC2 domain-containing protein [Bauldia sp.]
MANPVDSVGTDDGILTAYIDGELSADERAALEARLAREPELQARLEVLRRGDRSFAKAYEALLSAAPAERMQAMLADLAARRAETGRPPARLLSR